tara:strand:+ start:362 stop:544 length:183 start_codon:yes stop_codon:yes gene_type:complete
MPRAKKRKAMPHYTFVCTPEMAKRINAFGEKFKKDRPEVFVNTSVVLRRLIELGLQAEET